MLEDNGEQKDLSQEYELYIKHKGKTNAREFEAKFKKLIQENLKPEHPYPRGINLEVIVSVSMEQKRLKDVDIDNLIKSVLDCFNGLVYEDDSQILNVYGSKDVNGFLPLNGVFVGIRKMNGHDDSWFKNIKLAYYSYE